MTSIQIDESHGPAVSARHLANLRVLLVDDEDDSRQMLQAILTARGGCVTAVASASAALEALKSGTFDLLLSDICMPVQDGYALLRAVRSMATPHRLIPAIAVTGLGSDESRLAAFRAGFQRHVQKPVDVKTLLEVIEQLRPA